MRLLALRIAVAFAVSAKQLSPVGCQSHREGMKMAKSAIFKGGHFGLNTQLSRGSRAAKVPPPRVRPHKKGPKHSTFDTTIWPTVKLAAVAVVVILLGSLIASRIARPFRILSREDRETQKVSTDFQTLRKENQDLERKIHYLNSPQGVAQAARKLGYVKPGEITLVIPEPHIPPTPQQPKNPN